MVTPYPGATASEVSAEVSEVIEAEVQQMDEIKTVTSRNTPGVSVVEVEVRDTFGPDELPQVWDDLRDRVADAAADLPDGVRPSVVNDDFGDVFGIYYAITAPGFDDAEVWEIASYVRREMLAVDGVANAVLSGLPEEAIFVEPDGQALANLGVDPSVIRQAVSGANAVVPTGTAASGGRELRIDAPSGNDSVSDIAGLSFGAQGEVLNLLDVASVSRGRVETPEHIVRFDGAPAFTLGIAGLTSRNIVTVGHAVEARLREIEPILPVGVEVHPIYRQHQVVDAATSGFLVSLALSVGVVVGVLALFMGWRAAVVVGVSLLVTVVATFFFMYLWDVKVERISLGALIIAMGMLVDNAIVVAEGMQIEMRRGRGASDSAEEVAAQDPDPAARRDRHRHHGLRRHRAQPRRHRGVHVLALRGHRHLPHAVLADRHHGDAAPGKLLLPRGRARGGRGPLRRGRVPGLRRAGARRAAGALAGHRGAARNHRHLLLGVRDGPAAVLPARLHTDLLPQLQGRAGLLHLRRPPATSPWSRAGWPNATTWSRWSPPPGRAPSASS